MLRENFYFCSSLTAFVYEAALEDRYSAHLRSKGHVYIPFNLIKIMSPSGFRLHGLTANCKRFCFLSWSFPSYSRTHCMYREAQTPALLCIALWELGFRQPTQFLILWLLLLLQVGRPCLWCRSLISPTSMHKTVVMFNLRLQAVYNFRSFTVLDIIVCICFLLLYTKIIPNIVA